MFTTSAVEKIAKSDLSRLVVTDSIPLSRDAEVCDKIQKVSIAELISQGIRRVYNQESVSSLFI